MASTIFLGFCLGLPQTLGHFTPTAAIAMHFQTCMLGDMAARGPFHGCFCPESMMVQCFCPSQSGLSHGNTIPALTASIIAGLGLLGALLSRGMSDFGCSWKAWKKAQGGKEAQGRKVSQRTDKDVPGPKSWTKVTFSKILAVFYPEESLC